MNAATIKLIRQASCWLHLFPLKHNLQNNYSVQISESLPQQGQRGDRRGVERWLSDPQNQRPALLSHSFTPLHAFSLLFYFMNRIQDLIFGYWIFFLSPTVLEAVSFSKFSPSQHLLLSLCWSLNIQRWMRDKPKYVSQTDGSLWTLTATILSTKLSNTLYEDRIFVVLCIHITTHNWL